MKLGKPLGKVLESTATIRHTAVHRLKVTVTRLEQYLSDAQLLSSFLGDATCSRRLTQIRREMSVAVDELKRNKDVVESKLAHELQKIAARRSALDRAEVEAVEEMLRQDCQYQELAGVNLEQSIRVLEEFESGAPTEHEAESHIDLDTDTEVPRE